VVLYGACGLVIAGIRGTGGAGVIVTANQLAWWPA